MKFCVSLFLLFACCAAGAQNYVQRIASFRKHYTDELLADPRKPITASQVKFMHFYPPDESFCVWADVVVTPGSTPFMVPTHSGKNKPFRQYGLLKFRLGGDTLTLHVYQLVDLMNDAAHKDDLFVPFTDGTNYNYTYGGGRYIDLSTKDVQDGKILLDFNKCYNPYCAYADGFSCPIPPLENHLNTDITAGEKMFQR